MFLKKMYYDIKNFIFLFKQIKKLKQTAIWENYKMNVNWKYNIWLPIYLSQEDKSFSDEQIINKIIRYYYDLFTLLEDMDLNEILIPRVVRITTSNDDLWILLFKFNRQTKFLPIIISIIIIFLAFLIYKNHFINL